MGSAVDGADLNFSKRLSVTLTLLIMLTATHLEDANLGKPALRRHGGGDCDASHQGRAHPHFGTFAHSQDLIDRDHLADVSGNFLNFDLLAGGDPVLLPTGFNDRVHISTFQFGS